jgi:hypothetical protein
LPPPRSAFSTLRADESFYIIKEGIYTRGFSVR